MKTRKPFLTFLCFRMVNFNSELVNIVMLQNVISEKIETSFYERSIQCPRHPIYTNLLDTDPLQLCTFAISHIRSLAINHPTAPKSIMASFTQERFVAILDLGLSQFILAYDEILQSHKPSKPIPSGELMEYMREAFAVCKTDTTTKTVSVTTVETMQADTEAEAVAEARKQAEATAKATAEAKAKEMAEAELQKMLENEKNETTTTPKKVCSKLLKGLTMKSTKATKDGEEKETDTVLELPYLPHCINYSCCQALKLNGNLFTPCMTRPSKGSDYCKVCTKGGLKYGTIADREKCVPGEYVDPSGKKEISYGTWLQKRDLEQSFVLGLIKEKFGDDVTIPESYLAVNKAKARRGVKKSKSSSSASSTGSDTASVVSDTDVATTTSVETPTPAAPQPPVTTSEEKSKKKHGRPAKATKPLVVNEEEASSQSSQSQPQPEKEQKPQEEQKETEKSSTTPTTTTTTTTLVEPEPQDDEVDDLDSDIDFDDEDDAIEFTYEGKTYYRDSDNQVIQKEEATCDCIIVGTWDAVNEKVIFDK
jgi:hypothetical protein